MTSNSPVEIAMSCFVAAMALLFVLAHAAVLSAKLRAMWSALTASDSSGVDAMMEQMYGSGKGTEAEYARTRNAQAQRRKGGQYGKG